MILRGHVYHALSFVCDPIKKPGEVWVNRLKTGSVVGLFQKGTVSSFLQEGRIVCRNQPRLREHRVKTLGFFSRLRKGG
ncbi:MAG: hypothetical protein H6Q67_567 [Firmicutes bacterium]|nr:hypothetical protein [Bacillota bacterium]